MIFWHFNGYLAELFAAFVERGAEMMISQSVSGDFGELHVCLRGPFSATQTGKYLNT